jgi:protein-S-isoprenylcysteine O-methyltransferase Ste14
VPSLNPLNAIYVLWGIWVFSWIAASVWTARTEARPGGTRGLPYYIFTAIGAFMLFRPIPTGERLWPDVPSLQWGFVALTAMGFLFCWWARLHLGALWSGAVTKKEGHHVVDTGPYRLVRHPIYTGIIIASFALAGARATPAAIEGATIMALGWFLKARLEERFLRQELGADAYGSYAARVPMLLPLVGV